MKILLAILLGFAVLFYLLSREDFEVGETIHAFAELIPWLMLGVQLVNWIFGTDFSEAAFLYVWLGLVAIWTFAAIRFVIDEPRKRRKREEKLRRIFSSEEF